jgi:hypothetical protein
MQTTTAILALACLALAAGVNGEATDWKFEDARVGELPAGWSAAKTGDGPGSVWKVIEDDTSPALPRVLAQVSAESPRVVFNLSVLDEPVLADVDLSVGLKAVAGRIDQGGGPVWRYQDHNNYYIARVNPLENNFRVYKVVNGERHQLDTADVDAPAERWHLIHVQHQGTKIECWLDGELLLEAEDNAIPGTGRVGLWTKADAVTSFDGLSLSSAE